MRRVDVRSVSISGRAGFIGSTVTDFYLGSDVRKLVVVDDVYTGPFENKAHIKDPRCRRATCLSMNNLSSGSGTRRRGSRNHPDSFDRARRWGGLLMARIVEIGQVVMIAQRSSVVSGPARSLVIERGIGSDNHLKVGTFND